MYEYIVDCATYEEAIEVLKGLYVTPTNEIYSRHLLATRKQEESESLDQFLHVLRRWSKDCNFTAVTVLENEQGYIRDAFINGIRSREIRQRLLENKILTLDQALEQTRTLERAQKNSATYSNPDFHTAATDTCQDENIAPPHNLTAASTKVKCFFFCGLNKHPRKMCPAKDSVCNSCGKTGHYARVCKSAQRTSNSNKSFAAVPTLAVTSSCQNNIIGNHNISWKTHSKSSHGLRKYP